jgi:protoheme IX farnesyltransferase
MSETVAGDERSVQAPLNPWVFRLVVAIAVVSLILIVFGGLVTGQEHALAVPDWPTTYGDHMLLFPISKMVGGIFYEHTHRLLGMIVGTLTLILAIALSRPTSWRDWLLIGVLGGAGYLVMKRISPTFGGILCALAVVRAVWVWSVRSQDSRGRWIGLAALAAVSVQGVLGGIRVTHLAEELAPVHGCLAHGFFAFLAAIAVMTSRGWRRVRFIESERSGGRVGLFGLCCATTVLVFIQIALGSVQRHFHDEDPLSVPLAAHVLGALAVIGFSIWTSLRVNSRHRSTPPLVFASAAVVVLVAIQLLLGVGSLAARILAQEEPQPPVVMVGLTTAHVAAGALLLASCVVLSLFAFRVSVEGAPAILVRSRDYLALTKPRLTALVTATACVGFFLGADTAGVDWVLLAHTMIGVAMASGGASALNQLWEMRLDAMMQRTESRPLPSGRLSPASAFGFGTLLSIGGIGHLAFWVGWLPSALAGATIAAYLFVYTPLKTRTYLCTVIGAIPGALPPLIGWTGAGGELTMAAWVLFAILFFWQVPHFYAIARLYRDDYARAGFPMLPVIDPSGRRTGRQIVLFLAALAPATLAPAWMGLAGGFYAAAAILLGVTLLFYGIRLAVAPSALHARGLFRATLVYLPGLLITLSLDRIVP